MKKLGVVIPTYNRREKLQAVLDVLNKQTLGRSQFEVVVVDDGSTDDTYLSLEQQKEKWGFELQIFTQENAGQGMARNLGVEKTDSEYILFIQDDTLPARDDFLELHLRALEEGLGRVATLGYTIWHPDLPVTRFREWLQQGVQFDYRGMSDGQETDFWHFYTSNLGVKRDLLLVERFDENFAGWGWEDIELGYRLVQRRGVKIRFVQQAKAWHWHEMDESALQRRIETAKQGAQYFEKKHPEVRVQPHGWKWLVLFCLTRWPIRKLAALLKVEWGWYLDLKSAML